MIYLVKTRRGWAKEVNAKGKITSGTSDVFSAKRFIDNCGGAIAVADLNKPAEVFELHTTGVGNYKPLLEKLEI